VAGIYYLYCLVPAAADPPAAFTGIDGRAPVLVEKFPETAAVCCETARDEFFGADAEKNLQDLAWVGPRALRHEEVILACCRRGPVLPVRFGTVFSGREQMRNTLERHQQKIAEFFRRIAGKEEWTVKGLVNRPAARSYFMTQKIAAGSEDLQDLSPGKRYFAAQRLKMAADKELQSWLREGAAAAVHRLRNVAVDFSPRRLLGREVAGGEEEMFFNGAFLIDKNYLGRMEETVQALNEEGQNRGVHYELSGPWPPYSFTPSLEEAS